MQRTTLIKATAALATLMAAPTLVAADSGIAQVTGTNPSMLKVKSNGQDYTKLDLMGKFVIGANLEFDTGTAGRIKQWTMEPEMEHGYGIAAKVPGLAFYKKTVNYSVGNRPKTLDYNHPFAISVGNIENAALSMCRWKANSLRQQGKSNKQIFAKNYDVSFKVTVKATVNSTGAGSNNQIWEAAAPHVVKVRCMKWNGPTVPQGSQDLAAALKVHKATMQLAEAARGDKQCKVKTTTAISTNRGNASFKYRFVHSSGSKSQTFTTSTKANKIAVVKHDWDVPIVSGPENGWFRIEGVGTNFKSNKANYSMNCGGKAIVGQVAKKKPSSRAMFKTN